jgi:hypothetical protein
VKKALKQAEKYVILNQSEKTHQIFSGAFFSGKQINHMRGLTGMVPRGEPAGKIRMEESKPWRKKT